MPKGTYEKKGLIAEGTGLIYVKSPGGAIRRENQAARKAQQDMEKSMSLTNRAARAYMGVENVAGNSAKQRIDMAQSRIKQIRNYVKKTRNK